MTDVPVRIRSVVLALAMLLLASNPASASDSVVLRLRWDHQFQFAGYYAAQWQGYYADAGLNVEIRSAFAPDGKFHSATREVAEGNADFGVGGADILKARDRGAPLVVLASVLQQSPVAFYALRGTRLESPADLVGKRVATLSTDSIANVELRAMLRAEHIDPDLVEVRPITEKLGLYDLVRGHADVVAGYTISAAWVAQELGVNLTQLRPAAYGIDFYGSAIFAHQRLIDSTPGLAERFTAASLKGWEYALQHPIEIADRISTEFTRTIPIGDVKSFNRYQIEPVARLTNYPVVQLGHVNPSRWKLMHEALTEAGQTSGMLDLDAFIYNPERLKRAREMRLQQMLLVGVGLLSAVALLGFTLAWLLKRKVLHRTLDLAHSETRFKNLIEGSIQGIVIHRELKPLFVNQAYAEMFGYGSPREILGMDSIAGMYHPEDLAKIAVDFRRARNAGQPIPAQHQYRAVRRDGQELTIECQLREVLWDEAPAIQATVFDITDRIHLENQLRQAQKMEAVGQLAGGVAHDFNNMLHIIQSYSELALHKVERGNTHGVADDLRKVLRATASSSDLTRQLLAFSRQQVLKLRPIDVNSLVQDIAAMLQRLLGEHIELIVRAGRMPGKVLADRGMVEQVIVNLCVNARDAMPDGGVLTLETGVFTADRSHRALQRWSHAGAYAVISVSDQGVGIAPEQMQQIFEPFFTTKKTGKGTGLGLSVAEGIVQQHRGQMTVTSAPGSGSTFKVFLPLTRATEVQERPVDAQPAVWEAHETVLVAEDEATVRELTVTMLQSRGYRALVARDGVEACELFDAHADDIDLVLLDVMMPRRPGKAVFEHVRSRRPTLPVVFSSGYAAQAIDASILAEEAVFLLQKPYSADVLLKTLLQALEPQSRPPPHRSTTEHPARSPHGHDTNDV